MLQKIIKWFGNVIIVRNNSIINKDILNKSTVVLFPLPVSEFIVFQPVLGSVALHA